MHRNRAAPQGVLKRERVFAALDEALQRPICWVGAGAGCGKTTAISEYLSVRSTNAVWYRAGARDADIAVFFHGLTQIVAGECDLAHLPVFGPEYARSPFEFGRRFFRQLFASFDERAVIVFDDVHNPQCGLFREVLAIALSEIPPMLRCICISRSLPFQELSKLEMQGQIAVIDAEALSFTHEEAAALFSLTSVDPRAAEWARQTTGGWVAGLVLIGNHLREAGTTGGELADLDKLDTKARLFEFLARYVVEDLSSDQQRLLMLTSLLPEVTPQAAAELLPQLDVAHELSELYARQLFITKRVSKTTCYRYHDLLREFFQEKMHTELSLEEARNVQRQVARLLARRDYHDAAIDLALRARDWRYARELLIAHAQALVNAGRHSSIIDWTKQFPERVVRTNGWLCYWLASAWSTHAEATAEEWFERAYGLFERCQDVAGMGMTAASAFGMRSFSWLDDHRVEIWARRARRSAHTIVTVGDPNRELMMLASLLWSTWSVDDEVETADAAELSCRIVQLIAERADEIHIDARLTASLALIVYATNANQPELLSATLAAEGRYIQDEGARPWTRANWLLSTGIALFRFPTIKSGCRYLSAEEMLAEAANIGEREGFRSVLMGALTLQCRNSKLRNDLPKLTTAAERLQRSADINHEFERCAVLEAEVALRLLRGDYISAVKYSEELVALAKKKTFKWASPFFLTHFQALVGAGRFDQAQAFPQPYLSLGNGLYRQVWDAYLTAANLVRIKRSGDVGYLEALGQWISALRLYNITTVFNSLPSLLGGLFADALRYGFEPDFCRRVIQYRNLLPPSPEIEQWPWPVKVFALGGLGLEVNGQSVVFCGKAQKKPLELLKVLVALGGEVQVDQVIACLWPTEARKASRGKESKKLVQITVHRLRKLLARDAAILLVDGKLSLNRKLVWIDVFSFEQILDQAQVGLDRGGLCEESSQPAHTLLRTYGGALFGSEDPAPWALPLRERLSAKFLQLVSSLGRFYEARRQWDRAIEVYEFGLVQNNLVEEFYRGLIRSNVARGEIATAIEAYRRCREMFSVVLGVFPSSATRHLVKKARSQPVSDRTDLARAYQENRRSVGNP